MQVVSTKNGIGFPHAKQAARITRSRMIWALGRPGTQTVYAITRLAWRAGQPGQTGAGHPRPLAIGAVRWVCDMAFGEEATHAHTGRRLGASNIAAATHTLNRKIGQLLTLIDHPLRPQKSQTYQL